MTRRAESFSARRTESLRAGQRARLRGRRGSSVAELLLATLIAVLAAAVAVRSLAFAVQLYQARTGETEARLLCDTISLLIQDDLTRKSPAQAAGAIADSRYAPIDGKAPELSDVVLPDACYGPEGSVTRRVEEIRVEPMEAADSFHVTVAVSRTDGPPVSNTFTVTALG